MPKAKKSKKDTALYDERGRWVEERKRIEHGMRTAFKLSPKFQECIKSSRVELPRILKDGSVGKQNRVLYKCAVCGELFKIDHVRVDHIEPVCFVWMRAQDASYDLTARRIFCKIDNLQVICQTPKSLLPKGQQSCHTKKSARENFIRQKWVEFAEKQENYKWLFSLDDDFNVRTDNDRGWITRRNEEFNKQYDEYLENKRAEEDAKEERKRLRELKRAKK